MKFIRIICIILLINIFFLSNSSYTLATVDTSNLNIECPNIILIESTSGKILYEKNAYEKAYPASVTKVLTALLILENCKLTDIVKVSYNAIMSVPVGYAHAYLQLDEEFTVEDLLYMLLVNSANDAANVLAEHIAGSIESFATMMNTRAIEFGCLNTHFTNPSGIHDENHYTTAYDLSLITKEAMKNEKFRQIVSTIIYSIDATEKYDARIFQNTNLLLRPETNTDSENYYYKYANGVKTGFTQSAKNCIIASAKRDTIELIVVALGGESTQDGKSQRYIDSINLFEFGFNNYTIINLKQKGEIINVGTLNTIKELEIIVSNDINVIVEKKDSNTDFIPQININENLSLPIEKNTIVGTISYTIDDKTYSCELLAKNDVKEFSSLETFVKMIIALFILWFAIRIVKTKKKISKKKHGNYRKNTNYKNMKKYNK